MLRLETETGWWLVTHVDHANLAGAFAARWGNELFRSPEPRAHVLKGISRHDDGWRERDAQPQITRQGKPSAFSVELVGKYSAFEEIDLADYLAVRDRAVRLIAEEDPYAAILVSMHTYNLLSERADRSTIAPEQLPLLDEFLAQQKALQQSLREQIAADARFTSEQVGRCGDPRSFPAAAGDRQSLAARLRGLPQAGDPAASAAAERRWISTGGCRVSGRAQIQARSLSICRAVADIYFSRAPRRGQDIRRKLPSFRSDSRLTRRFRHLEVTVLGLIRLGRA